MNITIHADALGRGPYSLEVERGGQTAVFEILIGDAWVTMHDRHGAMTACAEFVGPPCEPEEVAAIHFRTRSQPLRQPPKRTVVVERIKGHPGKFSIVGATSQIEWLLPLGGVLRQSAMEQLGELGFNITIRPVRRPTA